MKKIPGILFVLFVSLSSCSSKQSNQAAEKDSYNKTEETLEDKEKKDPLMFLAVNTHYKHNLFGKTVIKGNIVNSAKVCTYKDVQLELSFYSKTGTLLEKDTETEYDEIAPGNSFDFKTKYFAPKGTDSIMIKITDAKPK